MSILNLTTKKTVLSFGKDDVIIQKFIAGIKGGRTLVVDDSYPANVIFAGTPVIVKDGVYKPFPLTAQTEALPTAALTTQTTGSAISGTVYVEVTASTADAVKCAFSDGTIIYLNNTAATGNAEDGVKYYSKDTSNKTTVYVYDEDGNKIYILGSLTSGYAYAGILVKSILKSKPAASIMTMGQVNIAALYYNMDSILSAFKTACPHIEFIKDEEA